MILRAIAVLAALSLDDLAMARDAAASSRGQAVSWEKLNVFTLTLSSDSGPGRVTYRGEGSFTTGDLRLDVDLVDSENKQAGTMLVVGGKVMAVRGLELPAHGVDPLHSAIIALRLVTSALMVASPDGPDAVKGAVCIDHRETEKALRVGAPPAGRQFPPPWSVRGQVDRSRDGTIAYDLELSVGRSIPYGLEPPPGNLMEPESRVGVRCVGTLSASATAPGLSDQFSLKGWKTYSLLGAPPPTPAPPTIGAVREALRLNNDPGTNFWRDFSGF